MLMTHADIKKEKIDSRVFKPFYPIHKTKKMDPKQPNIKEEKKGVWKTEDPAYINTLSQAVEEYKRKFPDKYERAQRMGELIMEHVHEDWQVGKDADGEQIRARQLLDTVRDYCLEDSDLSPEEQLLLSQVYGPTWRIKHLAPPS